LIVLSMDTSTLVGSVAVTREKQVLAEYTLQVRLTHTRHLLLLIERIMEDCGITFDTLDALAVTVGPGSFTGLRLGIATVKGLAYAAGKPVAGIPTLLALAENLPFAPYPICPMLDAKKKEVYCGLYQIQEDGIIFKEWEDCAISPQNLINHIHNKTIFLGEGSRLYQNLLKQNLGAKAVFVPDNYNFIRASNVGRLAYERLKQGKGDDVFTLTPCYLRRSEAEISREKHQ
jgi:tRNA threonylcarbamoyladenosine biosynthesis protein TsaB